MARERKFSDTEVMQEAKRLLLQHGYEGFHFSLLAEQMGVSRGVLYKYYANKDELIMELMLQEMDIFLTELKQIEQVEGFEAQFHFLIDLIFKSAEIHQLIGVGGQVPQHSNENTASKKKQLDQLHLHMYSLLQSFVESGKEEGMLRRDIPDDLVLGFIFQTIAIPNHRGIPQTEWVASIKRIIRHGMFTA